MSRRLSLLSRNTILSLSMTFSLGTGLTQCWAQDLENPNGIQEEKKSGLDDPIVIDPNQTTPNRTQQQLPSPEESLGKLPAQSEDAPDQKIVVRERYAGWKQASTDRTKNIDDQLRANWVMLSSSGLLNGRVLAGQEAQVAKIPVYLFHHGQIVNQTTTDDQGNFSFNNMEEASYSLVGFGPDAFFAFGFNAVDYRESTAGRMASNIEVMAVPNKTTINLDWIRYFSPGVKFRVFGRFISREGSDDPAWLYGLDGLATHGPTATGSTSIAFTPTVLGPGGRLLGRIHQIDELNGRPVDIRAMRAMLLKDNDVAAAVSVDNFGVFEFTGVQPGQYSLVTVGADGLGCIGIEAIDGKGDETVVDMALVSPDTIGWLNHTADETAYQRVIGRARPVVPTCEPNYGNIEALYCKRRGFIKQLFETLNCYADLMYYGETTQQYGNGQSGNGGNGGGCNQCGGGGCPNCQGTGVAPAGCGGVGCNNPACPTCNPGMAPPPPTGMAPPALVPTPAIVPMSNRLPAGSPHRR